MFSHQFSLQESNSLNRSLSDNGMPPTPMKKSKKRRASLRSINSGLLLRNGRSASVPRVNILKSNQVQFINHGLIGKGSFGLVFKIQKITSSPSKFYALKRSIDGMGVINNNNGSISCLSDIDIPCLSEIKILKKLQNTAIHPNIIKFRVFFFKNNRLHQIHNLYPHGTLKQLIEFQQFKLNSLQIAQILTQIINGLYYIHSKNIIHCDIKPDNIFIDKNYLLKIGDFGIATDVDIDIHSNETAIKLASGDPIYIAPEILNKIDGIHLNNEYLKNIDIFSLGIIGIELIYNLKLIGKGELFHHLRNIDNSNGYNTRKWFADDDKNNDNIRKMIKNEFITKMLDKNPKNRISSKNLVLKMEECWSDSFRKESWRQFIKLKLPSIIPSQSGIDQFPMFCCDKEKINHIPIKKVDKIKENVSDDTACDLIQKLTF